MTFVFYDCETTGTHPAFDQIVQFAAIRTDADLNELERFEVRSRLLPYVVPSPYAMKVTGLTLDDLLNPQHPSYFEMVCRVREALAGWCPAAFIGFNSIRFDEEFLRQAFYQCLHPPYLTNTGGSKRVDALTLVRSAAYLHPNALAVPLNEKGKPVFKLDRVAPANGFEHLNAHDALADVEATIHLCRLVKQRCPDVWEQVMRLGSKAAVAHLMRSESAFVQIDDARQRSFVVTALVPSGANPNLTYCWDLTTDPRPYMAMSGDELGAALSKANTPVRKVKVNAAPALCRVHEAPQHALGGYEVEALRRRGEWVGRQRQFAEAVATAVDQATAPYPVSDHVERQIYDGFWSSEDEWLLREFHAASWEERVRIAGRLQDPRLVWLARRIIWVERPDLCPEEHAAALAVEKAMRLVAEDGQCEGWNTLGRAAADLERLVEEMGPEKAADLHSMRAFIAERVRECKSRLSFTGS